MYAERFIKAHGLEAGLVISLCHAAPVERLPSPFMPPETQVRLKGLQ